MRGLLVRFLFQRFVPGSRRVEKHLPGPSVLVFGPIDSQDHILKLLLDLFAARADLEETRHLLFAQLSDAVYARLEGGTHLLLYSKNLFRHIIHSHIALRPQCSAIFRRFLRSFSSYIRSSAIRRAS